MTFEEFTQSTIAVIEDDGLEAYHPMLAIPALQRLANIPNIPDDVDPREALQTIIMRNNLVVHEFMFGVRSAADEVTIGHFRPGMRTRLSAIRARSGDFEVEEDVACDWWTLHDDASGDAP